MIYDLSIKTNITEGKEKMETIELLQAEIQMKEHAINKLQMQIKDKEAQQNSIECDPDDFADQFDECLDGAGSIEVAGCTFYPSQVLKKCDPVAYRCGLNDFADSCFDKEETEEYQALQSEIDNIQEEIDQLESDIEDLQSQIEEMEETSK